jgi:hypothetical protein
MQSIISDGSRYSVLEITATFKDRVAGRLIKLFGVSSSITKGDSSFLQFESPINNNSINRKNHNFFFHVTKID